MRSFTAVVFLLCSAAFAKTPVAKDYQDATLVSFKTVADGAACSSTGTVNGTTDDSGKTTGTSNSTTSCSDTHVQLYTVRIGDNTYVLRPAISGKRAGADAALVIGTIGWGALFIHNKGVLNNQLPGAHIKIRPEGDGFEVMAGRKSSLYSIVEAQ